MGAAKFAFGTSLLGFFLSLFFFAMGCENSTVAGITVSYSGYVMSACFVSLLGVINSTRQRFFLPFSVSFFVVDLILSIFYKYAVNNLYIFIPLIHTERKALLLRNHLSSLTVIRVACAQERSGIQCVARTGSPMCPRAWPDVSPPLVLAKIRSGTHRWHNDTSFL